MNTYQTKEKLMAEQTDAHDYVQSRNKAMNFDRVQRQKKIKDNLELHQDTKNTNLQSCEGAKLKLPSRFFYSST